MSAVNDLLHASFELASKAYGASGHADAKDHLRQRFAEVDFDTITETYLAACRLHELAYSVADRNRDGLFSDDEALAQLRQHCPGFPEQTYYHALSQGWFESR